MLHFIQRASGLLFPEGPIELPDGRCYVWNNGVFDRAGGFYFTDLGKTRGRELDRGAVYYAQPDGSSIREVRFPMTTPNGVALSPDEDVLYVAETTTARLMGFPIVAPGELASVPDWEAHIASFSNLQLFDSLAVDAAGNICVATLVNGGITVIAADGQSPVQIPTGDPMTTNICFGGDDLRTAFITGSMRVAWFPARGKCRGCHSTC